MGDGRRAVVMSIICQPEANWPVRVLFHFFKEFVELATSGVERTRHFRNSDHVDVVDGGHIQLGLEAY